MKKTTNKYQEHYMVAKAHLDTLEAAQEEMERQYILANNIVNPDGTVPSRIYCIEDEQVFERANAEQARNEEESGLWAEILAAREVAKIAEAKLIEYGLSIAPAGVRGVLEKSCKTNYTTRKKVLDLALRLDVSTVG